MIGMLEVIYTKLNVRYVGRSIKIDLIIVGAAFFHIVCSSVGRRSRTSYKGFRFSLVKEVWLAEVKQITCYSSIDGTVKGIDRRKECDVVVGI